MTQRRFEHVLRGLAVGWLALVCACHASAPEPEPAAAQPAPAALTQPAATPVAPPAPASDDPAGDKAGWSALSRRDDLPLCVFAGHAEREQAQLITAAKAPQKLRANQKLVFGVFGPHCLNEACDERPNLQCWVEREGPNALRVHTRFSSLHKDGSSCQTDCMELDTACESEELPAGKYEVRQGDRSYKLAIPGSLRDPCLRRE